MRNRLIPYGIFCQIFRALTQIFWHYTNSIEELWSVITLLLKLQGKYNSCCPASHLLFDQLCHWCQFLCHHEFPSIPQPLAHYSFTNLKKIYFFIFTFFSNNLKKMIRKQKHKYHFPQGGRKVTGWEKWGRLAVEKVPK